MEDKNLNEWLKNTQRLNCDGCGNATGHMKAQGFGDFGGQEV